MPKDKFDFPSAYKKLQTIVEWFEKDDVDLEEGINKFEEGIKLTKTMKDYLNTMENKIKELKKDI